MSKSQEIILTAWSNSSSDKANGFGISEDDRDHLFKPLKSRLSRKGVIIEFPSSKSPRPSVEALWFSLPYTSSFWRDCHEFRSCEIGAWMKKRKDAPWPIRKPPKYIAELSTAGTGPIKIKVLQKLRRQGPY